MKNKEKLQNRQPEYYSNLPENEKTKKEVMLIIEIKI